MKRWVWINRYIDRKNWLSLSFARNVTFWVCFKLYKAWLWFATIWVSDFVFFGRIKMFNEFWSWFGDFNSVWELGYKHLKKKAILFYLHIFPFTNYFTSSGPRGGYAQNSITGASYIITIFSSANKLCKFETIPNHCSIYQLSPLEKWD